MTARQDRAETINSILRNGGVALHYHRAEDAGKAAEAINLDYDLAVVYAGEGDSALAPDNARSRFGRYEIEFRDLTVPAGGRVILMHFIAFGADLADDLADLRAASDLDEQLALLRPCKTTLSADPHRRSWA